MAGREAGKEDLMEEMEGGAGRGDGKGVGGSGRED